MIQDPQIVYTVDQLPRSFTVGGKASRLMECRSLGFNVPPLLIIPAQETAKLFANKSLQIEAAAQAVSLLPATSYAVRSSSTQEDSKTSSLAGQFHTETNVAPPDLADAIFAVLSAAHTYLKGDLSSFSIIIQEYILADYSGVGFSRNPSGGRELIIEYHKGEGKYVVDGSAKPTTITSYHSDAMRNALPFPWSKELVKAIHDIERYYEFPQDIEWCVKNNTLYILQARPITTLSMQDYSTICRLEKLLSKDTPYIYQKTELSEIAARPTPFTLSLLKKIYSENGPVQRVYTSIGVKYTDTDFLKIIGNELYVDRIKELQGLLPALTYRPVSPTTIRLASISALWATVKNGYHLSRLLRASYQPAINRIRDILQNPIPASTTISDMIKNFLAIYEDIFMINLLAGAALKKLQIILVREPISIAELLQAKEIFIPDEISIQPPTNLTGNSLDVADLTPFMSAESKNQMENTTGALSWWNSISSAKQTVLHPQISAALLLNQYREYGRWATVKYISEIRRQLFDLAEVHQLRDEGNIFFHTIEELEEGNASDKISQERRDSFEVYDSYMFPSLLTSSYSDTTQSTLGISSGVATGRLVNVSELDSIIQNENRPSYSMVLYTEALDPSLTKYFSNISGLISYNGGLLSHLAIMARESNLPAIAQVNLTDHGVTIGDMVRINGSTGEIEKIYTPE